MSRDTVKGENTKKIDISWRELIKASQSRITAHQEQIKKLRKSLRFFKIQSSSGETVPLGRVKKTSKIS